MPIPRKPGARGPLKKLYRRADRDALFMALIRYIMQRASTNGGVAEGETKLTLTKIADDFNTPVRTLQGYLPEVEKMLTEVRECSAAVGITQLEVVAEVKRYHEEVLDLLQQSKEMEGEAGITLRIKVLEDMLPVSLDKLQQIVPAIQSSGLTGQQERGDRFQLGMTFVQGLQGLEGRAAPKPVEAQRVIKSPGDE